MQKVSQRGLAEIAAHEGIVSSPYLDSVGVWTVGIGHTAAAGAPNPQIDRRTFSVPEIMDIFARDIAKFEARVRAAFKRPLTQAQFDAAVSFDFNTGGIHKATWVSQFNAGDMAAAKKSFMNWSKPAEIIPRRTKERDLFFDGKYSSDGIANLYPADAAGKVLWSQGKRVSVIDLMRAPTAPEGQPTPAATERAAGVQPPTATPEPQTGHGGLIAFLAAAALAGLAALASHLGLI